jgi:hypothetical protein
MQLEADVDSRWNEGYGARNLVLRNNRYEQPSCSGSKDSAVILIRATVDNRATNYPLIENILFENNIFENITGFVINAKSFKSLVFRNNEIQQHGKVANVNETCGSISAELGQGLWVENNTWSLGSDQAPPRLLYDQATTTLFGVQGNSLKN